jgi:hypothetical protein
MTTDTNVKILVCTTCFSDIHTGRLAQLVARQIPNLKVRSSILLLVTTFHCYILGNRISKFPWNEFTIVAYQNAVTLNNV